jgi:hypothetical protein
MSRQSVLRDLLELSRPLDGIVESLKRFPWDSEVECVALTAGNIASVLQRYRDGELGAETVEAWANAIELRDDIAYDPDAVVGKVLHELANPLMTERLTRQRALALLALCRSS